jgi:hypothetical protein
MIELKGDKREVLRYLGYKGQKIDSSLETELDEALKQGLSLAAPRTVYTVFDLEKTDGGYLLKGTNTVLEGNDISRYLDNAEKCAVMAVTVGAKIEKAIIGLEKSGSLKKASILDCVATELCEETADICNAEIKKEASALGYKCKPRFSPGYGDFPLETQRGIIPILSTEKRIGVTLNESCLMSPRKSVTAVIAFTR